ncbi:hypothetical protein JL720_1021 [Aureococcus anophagefferens]|nr:hypothetical protein JL720_1021 [Aureococcus anophagefferens]
MSEVEAELKKMKDSRKGKVAQDAEHHAAPARPPVGTTAKAAPRRRDYVGRAAANADEDSDDGAEDEDEEIVTENPTYYKIRSARAPLDRCTIVSDGWNHDGRRVVGISKDDWVMGPTLKCKTCERKCNARRSRAPEEKKEDKEFMKVFMKGYRYKFESYSVESVRLYEEKYPGFMAKQDFVITTRRTAMTRTLADIVRPLVNSGMNPNNISNLLAETKDLALTRSLLNATGAISDATAPGQHTLATALNRANLGNFVDEVMKFQTCSPGHKLVRRFVVDASEAVCHSQFSFREKKVGGAIIAIDHTLKTLKGQKVAQEKVSKNRLTVWSNELGAPMIALSTATTSMDDDAFGDITRLTKQYEGVEVKGEIIELSDLANDTLKSQKRRWSLADLVMELLNRTLDKELGGGGRYGRWDEWPLDQDAQQYAANDAAATFMVHARSWTRPGWVWVAPRDRAAAQDDGDAEADGDAELDGDAEGRVLADGAAELDGGTTARADDGADDGDDGADDDADDVGDLPNDDVEQEAPPDSVLAAATKLVVEYEGSNAAESLELRRSSTRASGATSTSSLATWASTASVGDECVDRHLVISRRGRSSATPAATPNRRRAR